MDGHARDGYPIAVPPNAEGCIYNGMLHLERDGAGASPAPCAYTADVAQLGEPGDAGSSPAVGTN